MKNRKLLVALMLVLAAAAVATPVFLKRIPLPLRLEAGFLDLLAAVAIAVFLKQTAKK